MVGKPNWFKRRKYGGWGLTPATWQGWAYIAIFVAILFGTQNIPFATTIQKTIATIFIAAIIAVLALGVAYQTATSAVKEVFQVDWVIVAALFTGLLIKAISNIYLDKKN